MDINPKCRHGDKLYVHHTGTVRPCCWIGHVLSTTIFERSQSWNPKHTSIREIKERVLPDFADSMTRQPFDICREMCSVESGLSNPTQKIKRVTDEL